MEKQKVENLQVQNCQELVTWWAKSWLELKIPTRILNLTEMMVLPFSRVEKS